MNEVMNLQIVSLIEEYNKLGVELEVVGNGVSRVNVIKELTSIWERVFPEFVNQNSVFNVEYSQYSTRFTVKDWGDYYVPIIEVKHYVDLRFRGEETLFHIRKNDFEITINRFKEVQSSDITILRKIVDFVECILDRKHSLISEVINVVSKSNHVNNIISNTVKPYHNRRSEIKAQIKSILRNDFWDRITTDGVMFEKHEENRYTYPTIYFSSRKKDSTYLKFIKVISISSTGKTCDIEYTPSYMESGKTWIREKARMTVVEDFINSVMSSTGKYNRAIPDPEYLINEYNEHNKLVTV